MPAKDPALKVIARTISLLDLYVLALGSAAVERPIAGIYPVSQRQSSQPHTQSASLRRDERDFPLTSAKKVFDLCAREDSTLEVRAFPCCGSMAILVLLKKAS